MGNVARTNIRSVNFPVPREVTPESFRAWAVGIAQALRFRLQGRTTTVGAVTSTLLSIATEDATVYNVKAWVLGRRTAGSGSLNDGYVAVLRGTFKVVNGVLSTVATAVQFSATDNAGFSSGFAISNDRIIIQVTGASGVEVTWKGFARVLLAKR